MLKHLNKRIPTPLAITIIAVLAILLAGGIMWQSRDVFKEGGIMWQFKDVPEEGSGEEKNLTCDETCVKKGYAEGSCVFWNIEKGGSTEYTCSKIKLSFISGNFSDCAEKLIEFGTPTKKGIPVEVDYICCCGRVNCDEAEDEIYNLLEEANYCNVDDDCVATTLAPVCSYPYIVNKNANLSVIAEKIENYWDNCYRLCKLLRGGYKPPKLGEIKCEDNKCVDARPYEARWE